VKSVAAFESRFHLLCRQTIDIHRFSYSGFYVRAFMASDRRGLFVGVNWFYAGADWQRHMSDVIMKKDKKIIDELRPEYNFSEMKGGIRGKYVQRCNAGTNLAKIDPDVAEIFTDDNSINEVLRSLIRAARRQVKPAH
jgi:hypothetical protein